MSSAKSSDRRRLFKERDSITPKDNPLMQKHDAPKKKRTSKVSEAAIKPAQSLSKQELIRRYIELKSQLRTVEIELEKTRKQNKKLSQELVSLRDQQNDQYNNENYEEEEEFFDEEEQEYY